MKTEKKPKLRKCEVKPEIDVAKVLQFGCYL